MDNENEISEALNKIENRWIKVPISLLLILSASLILLGVEIVSSFIKAGRASVRIFKEMINTVKE